MLQMENEKPTTVTNVEKHFEDLTRIVSILLKSGRSVKEILPRGEAQNIEAKIKESDLKEDLREAIQKLLKRSPAPVQAG